MIHREQKTLFPVRLRPGDAIGIAAPSGSFDKESIQSGIDVLNDMGFRTVIPEGLYEKNGYLAGSDAHRAGLLNDLFADPGIQGIMCARGGFGSMKILSLLDYDLIRRHPKAVVGFSDISAILYALYDACGLVTFHGPVLTTLGEADLKTKESLLSALSSDKAIDIFPGKGKVIRHGRASGRVLGGNLTTLCHLVGTPFSPRFGGSILVLEDKGEQDYRIDRMLTQMRLAGCFDGVSGIVLGSFVDCGEQDRIFRIVEEIFGGEPIPIMAGFEIGHQKENMTIPIGAQAAIDSEKGSVQFAQCATLPDSNE